MAKKRYRPDQDSGHKTPFLKNKKALAMEGRPCAICGLPIDYTLTFPNPWSFTADHIIPIAKGGHPSAMENLQPAHLRCNRAKQDKVYLSNDDIYRLRLEQGCSEHTPGDLFKYMKGSAKAEETISNDDLPLSMDWTTYRSSE